MPNHRRKIRKLFSRGLFQSVFSEAGDFFDALQSNQRSYSKHHTKMFKKGHKSDFFGKEKTSGNSEVPFLVRSSGNTGFNLQKWGSKTGKTKWKQNFFGNLLKIHKSKVLNFQFLDFQSRSDKLISYFAKTENQRHKMGLWLPCLFFFTTKHSVMNCDLLTHIFLCYYKFHSIRYK